MIFVPAGDHVIDKAIRIVADNSGLWGPGRVIQSNPSEAIVEVSGAAGVQLRDLTLTRSEGAQETHKSGLHIEHCPEIVVANVRVIDNWSDRNAIRVENSERIVIRECYIKNYSRVSIDDRTATPYLGYAFNCTEGTGLNLINVKGAIIQGNRILELRLLPTPELKEKYELGKIVKKNATKGELMPQDAWDTNYINIWRQGAALHIGSGMTSDHIQLLGNFIENSQQGMDIQADHVVVSGNIVTNAPHGMKAIHGSRNILIVGNQFSKNDLFGIGLMQGTASHVAGQMGNDRGPGPVGANIDGYSIIAHNIISDFGFGLSHWLWPVGHNIGPAPIQLGGRALRDTPPLRSVIVDGNLVYDTGADQILVDGKPQKEAPRYRYAVRIEPGAPAPQNVQFSNNIFDPGLDGVSTANIKPVAR